MILNIIYIIAGVALVLWGADILTEGASSLARRMRVPEIVIGLTIVAAGTSAPEFFVSLVSALKGTPDLAVGNVLGSNIFNTMLIVGVSAMVATMSIAKTTVIKDIPFAVCASFVLFILCMDDFSSIGLSGNRISRIDGLILLSGFAVFMGYTLKTAKISKSQETPNVSKDEKVWKAIAFLCIGLACLVFGSDVFVGSATELASSLGISDGVIGLTVVAGGTSLPELATSVVAARKGRSAIAIGNVIGSNVFNLFGILGATAVICPMQINGITMIDMSVLLFSILFVWFFSFTKYTLARWEGAVLTVSFFVYLGWLIYNI